MLQTFKCEGKNSLKHHDKEKTSKLWKQHLATWQFVSIPLNLNSLYRSFDGDVIHETFLPEDVNVCGSRLLGAHVNVRCGSSQQQEVSYQSVMVHIPRRNGILLSSSFSHQFPITYPYALKTALQKSSLYLLLFILVQHHDELLWIFFLT